MPHKLKKVAAFAATIAATVAMLAGCSSPENGKGESLTYWSMWEKGEPQQQVMQDAIDAFTAETGIAVKVQWSGRDLLTQVIPRLNAGNPPDLVDQGASDILAALGPVNGTRDLTALYQTTITGESKTIAEVIPAPLIDTVKVDGKPFLVPYTLFGSSIWYNSKVTPSLLESSPKTWDDFLAAMDELKAAGRTPISIEGSTPENLAFWTWWALTRAGGANTLVDAAKDPTGELFTSDAWVKATDAMQQMIDGDYFPEGFNATKYPVQQAGWADQTIKSDVMIMGSWLSGETNASLKKSGQDPAQVIEYHSLPFPQISSTDKGVGLVEASAIGFAITSKALNPEAAEKFIAFFMKKEHISGIATKASNMTSRVDVDAPAELADYAAQYAEATGYVQLFDSIYSEAPKWNTDVWLPALSNFFAGKIDAQEFRELLKSKTIALLAG